MATPAMNFVAVCANANIPVLGSKAAHLKLLKESGVGMVATKELSKLKNASLRPHGLDTQWKIPSILPSQAGLRC